MNSVMKLQATDMRNPPDPVMLNDIELAQYGDTQAFTRLINKTRHTVTSIALAIVKDLDNSEEVAQEVFIATWQHLKELKNTTSFLPWIRQMTRYTAYNFLRNNKVDRKVSGERADYLLEQFCDPKLPHEEDLHREQQSIILNDFISELPEESREIVLLYYREDQSSKQVAQLLDITESNVRKKLSRVRKQLKANLLEKYGRLILGSGPTLAFSSLILSAVTHSSPVAAAAMSSTAVGGKSSVAAKLSMILGGAMIGAFAGVIAAIWSVNAPLKKMNSHEAKQQLKRYRNQTIAWIIISGIALSLSYELSHGWVAPVVVYTIFSLGLLRQIKITYRFIIKQLYFEDDMSEEKIKMKEFQYVCSKWGIFLGMVTGYAGLIIGLINSGRF